MNFFWQNLSFPTASTSLREMQLNDTAGHILMTPRLEIGNESKTTNFGLNLSYAIQ